MGRTISRQYGGTLSTFGKFQVEDYTNFTYNARLAAGAYGYEFMPVLPAIMYSDVFNVRGFMGKDKFGVVKSPFSGKGYTGCAGGKS